MPAFLFSVSPLYILYSFGILTRDSAIIPITAFCLGTWQVNRLKWKTDLIAKCEDRLIRDPLPLPPHIDPSAIADFDYRRVTATGRFRHDQEMLIGPRLHDGHDGFLVVTPLERPNGSTILVNRGWISKAKAPQAARAAGDEALPRGDVVVLGMLRQPWRRNAFTPANDPANGRWYFPDVREMAAACGAEPVWVEALMNMELVEAYRREEAGIPIGRPPEVNLRNNHAQYIFTWYALGLATAVMFYMVAKTPRGGRNRAVRRNVAW